jgi:uncharacterized protein YdhG (YjbR/CyaY superfamily)
MPRSGEPIRMKIEPKPDNSHAIDDYIAAFPDEIQILLKQLRSTIQKAAPEATEKISYGIPTYYHNGNLVHFAAFKKHIGFFPTPGAITAFAKEFKPYKTSKGTVQLPLADPLPLKLIERVVKFRMKENAGKKPDNDSKRK